MDYEIVITKTALADLDEIVSYIVNNLRNPQAASSLLDDYEEALRSIASNPSVFHAFKDEKGNNILFTDAAT